MSSMNSQVQIASPQLTAEIDPLGAQLSMLRDAAGHDLLWDGDPAFWSGRAPILFPIVGMLAGGSYRLGKERYALPRHGFARGRVFDLVSRDAGHALFRLRADAATLAVYPFRFELDVDFHIDGPTLMVTATVRNAGLEALPASLGFHPAFRWPLPYGQPREAHVIEFERDEPAPARRITADGLLSPQLHATPVVDRRLPLDDALFDNDVLIFDELRSQSVIFGAAHGPRLQLSFPDASHLGIWSKPGAGFVCIEPWQGVTDAVGYAGDFTQKPGVFLVPPRGSHALQMQITLQPAQG